MLSRHVDGEAELFHKLRFPIRLEFLVKLGSGPDEMAHPVHEFEVNS